MKPLTATCASLCAVTLLLLPQVRCEVKEVKLDMVPLSFDDQYNGCEEEMANKIMATRLLQTELDANDDLKQAWEKAKRKWEERKGTLPELPAGFKDEYGIALLVYTGSFYSKFNQEVRFVGYSAQDYMEHFHLKSLHFYVTRAVQILKNNCYSGCRTVYRGVKGIHFLPALGIGSKVRLGQFSSSSLKKDVANFFGNDTFFTITTCLGPCISGYAYLSTEEEVLVPTYEIFNVTAFNSTAHTFVLNSTGRTCSNYNCTYLGGGKPDACSHAAPRAILALPMMMTSQLFSGLTLLIHTAAMKLFR
ncbi:ecto-ADP-ribosyltransferase 5 isoform X2 [Microcaecilia unicolor]|uniref:NAD(P)(+)--arginine ADP-ribosyltransferase n=1 Tax=Microcaecilia unicolor TaxID=1415580 RepID=A0A6P7XYC6_9AMPH|nr:ecto-ADP-ribosyltransferase 5-like isoform X2 [Microcaecilia unicolor]